MSGVEFLPDDGATGAGEPPPSRTRRWWILGVLVLVVVALVWAISHPSHRPKLAPHAAAPQSSSPAARDSNACHGTPFCAASAQIPDDLRAVIRHYLPAVQSLQVSTHFGRSLTSGTTYLADRTIHALAGSVTVLLSLHRNYGGRSGPSALVEAPAGVGSMVLRSTTEMYTIDLQYLAPETVPPSRATLRMLTLDPRLESL